jgi:TolA-binding protein
MAKLPNVGPLRWVVPLLQKIDSTNQKVEHIHRMLHQVLQNQEKQMALADDLVQRIQDVETTDATAVQILKDLAAKAAASGSVSDATIQDAIARLDAANQGLSAESSTDDPSFTPPAPAGQ